MGRVDEAGSVVPVEASSYENFGSAQMALTLMSLLRLSPCAASATTLSLRRGTDETSMLNSFASLRRRDAESRTLSEIGSLISRSP